jgi:hypothetical protein
VRQGRPPPAPVRLHPCCFATVHVQAGRCRGANRQAQTGGDRHRQSQGEAQAHASNKCCSSETASLLSYCTHRPKHKHTGRHRHHVESCNACALDPAVDPRHHPTLARRAHTSQMNPFLHRCDWKHLVVQHAQLLLVFLIHLQPLLSTHRHTHTPTCRHHHPAA